MRKLTAILLGIALCGNVIADVPKKVMSIDSSTVLIKIKVVEKTPEQDKKPIVNWGICSGVYIDSNTILSAAHCVRVPEDFKMTNIWVKSNGYSSVATPIKIDEKLDLALFHVDRAGVPVKLASEVQKGSSCWAFGNPLGIEATITEGIVSKVDFKIKGRKPTYLVTSTIVLPGNSGGAIVNSDGQLIGILVMSTSMVGSFGASGLGVAIDLKTVKGFLK